MIPNMKGKSHHGGTTTNGETYWEEVVNPQIRDICLVSAHKRDISLYYLNKQNVTIRCHIGARYKTTIGVVHVNFNNDTPPAPQTTKEEIEVHIMGVMLTNLYNMKELTYLITGLKKQS